MDSGAQVADEIVRLTLQGTVFFLKVSGQATATLLSFLAASASQNSKASGKVRLKSLLMSGSELKVFTVQGKESFLDFAREAKRYGILFSVVKRTKDDKETGVYDIMVRAEDASKLNRIIEKHHMAEVEGTARQVEPPEADIEKRQVLEARDLLSRMMEPDASRNPEEALEDPSRSNALYRMPNRTNRRSVVKEVESYIEEAKQPAKPRVNEHIMPNLMQQDEADETKSREDRSDKGQEQEA